MSASQVETLCRPSHLYKSLRKVTCRRVTSLKVSDTAGLHSRAETDLSLLTSRGRLHCMRACIYLGGSHWALEGCSEERQEGPTGKHRVPPAPQAQSFGGVVARAAYVVFKLLCSSPLSLPKYAQLSLS